MTNPWEEIEGLIQSGRFSDALIQLSKIKREKLSDEDISKCAQLYRLSGLPMESVKVLAQALKRNLELEKSDPQLSMEYAASLGRLGAFHSAESLLLETKDGDREFRDFQLGLLYMTIWDYATSKEYFEDLVEESPNDMRYLLNLAASLAFEEDYKSAKSNAESALEMAKRNNSTRFQAFSLELLTSIKWATQEFDSAVKSIQEFRELPHDMTTGSAIFIKKWEALTDFAMNGDLSRLENSLTKLAHSLAPGQHMETLRDIQYQLAKAKNDPSKLTALYFGTPFESFRHRMRMENPNLEIPGSCIIDLKNMALTQNDDAVLDFYSPESILADKELSDGLILKSIHTLTSDLIKPLHITALTDELYPGEKWVLDSIEKKVERILSRTRKALQKHGDIQIKLKDHFLSLSTKKPFSIRKIECVERRSQMGIVLRHIERKIGLKFKAKEARELTGFSVGKMHGLLEECQKQNLVTVIGTGNSRMYEMKLPQRQ